MKPWTMWSTWLLSDGSTLLRAEVGEGQRKGELRYYHAISGQENRELTKVEYDALCEKFPMHRI